MKLPFRTDGDYIGLPTWALGNNDPVRVMLIDDDHDEALLTFSLLSKVDDTRYVLDWVPTYREGLASIAQGEHDAYLVDHQLGAETGVDLVRKARASGSHAAMIMMTGLRDRTTDLAAMDAGATDFLMKGRTDAAELDRSLRYSISQARLVSALDRSRSQLAGLEELAKLLVDNGPTRETMERIVDLIVQRFSLPCVAVYLSDGAVLHLAAQRGYQNPAPKVSRTDAGVERVARAGQPIFVPSLSPEISPGALGRAIATELSVPLLVAGELAGLLNVGSTVAKPIGEEDFAAVRLVADRMTAALTVMREQTVAHDRLRSTRTQLAAAERLVDSETSAYPAVMLQPLLEMAIATAGTAPHRELGLLLVGCADGRQSATPALVDLVRGALPGRPIVRLSKSALAVPMVGGDAATARTKAGELVVLARTVGLSLSCGYASLDTEWTFADLLGAAETALGVARGLDAPTIVS